MSKQIFDWFNKGINLELNLLVAWTKNLSSQNPKICLFKSNIEMIHSLSYDIINDFIVW